MKKYILLGALSVGLIFTGFSCKGKTPEQVLEQMKVVMAEQESGRFEIDAKIDANKIEGQAGSDLQSALPGVTGLSMKLSGIVAEEEGVDYDQEGEFSFVIDGDQALEVTGEYKMVDGVSYVYFSELDLPQLFALFINEATFEKKWINFDSVTDLQNEFLAMAEDANEESANELTEEQLDELKKLFADFSMFTEAELVEETELNGVKVGRYKAKLDADGIHAFMQDISKVLEEEYTKEDEQEMRDVIADVNAGNLEFWVGLKDSLLYQVAFEGKIEDPETGMIPVDLVVSLSDYDQEFEVSAPESSEDFDALFEQSAGTGLFGGFGAGDLMMEESQDAMADLETSMLEFEKQMAELEKQFEGMEQGFNF